MSRKTCRTLSRFHHRKAYILRKYPRADNLCIFSINCYLISEHFCKIVSVDGIAVFSFPVEKDRVAKF